jgi:hypothetical protein
MTLTISDLTIFASPSSMSFFTARRSRIRRFADITAYLRPSKALEKSLLISLNCSS